MSPDPKPSKQSPPPVRRGDWAGRKAWWPIPLLLVLIAGLWVADLRTVYESRALMVLLNLFFTWLASLCICFLTARGFLGSGQPGLLMFGCGSLLWGGTSLAAAVVVNRVNATVTIHNLGILGAALCHLTGVLWHGRLSRRGRWLVAGYAGALMTGALIFWAAMAGATPVFFVQGHGGTLIREVVLLLAIVIFAWVAWQMIQRAVPRFGVFYHWYGLGLGLVATGLTGVFLLSVQGGILGWANRLTQYLGSAYLLVAAVAAARETGTWKLSLSAVEEAWLKEELLPAFQNNQRLRFVLRYGFAIATVAFAFVVRQAITARIGPGLPPYLLFATTAVVVVLFAGLGPWVLCVLLTDLVVGYWILPPVGQFHIASPVDRLGLIIYTCAGLFFCVIVELARRNREKAAVFDREAAVRASRERLAAFAEATFEGIVESEAGRIVDCNEQFAQMAGWSVAELRGKEIDDLIAPEDRERAMASIKHDRGSVSEHAMLRKDGTRLDVETRGQPVSPGSAKRHTAIRDITQRKCAEESLRESVERLGMVLQASSMGTFEIDLMTGNSRWNEVAFELLGLQPGAAPACPETFFSYVHSGDLETVHAHWEEALRTGTLNVECRVVRADGEERWLAGKGRFIFDDKRVGDASEGRGRAIRFLGVNYDITERKATETALRASEERYRLLAETMLQGVVHQDSDGKIIAMNPAAERILGKTREQFMGSSSVREEGDTIRLDGSIFPGVEHPSMVALRTGEQQNGVIMGVFNPILGDYRWISIDAIPVIRPGETRPSEAYAVFEDITERKRAEDASRESAERLDLALRSSRMGTFDWDIVRNKRTWGDDVHRLFGTDPSAFTGTTEEVFQTIHPEDRGAVEAAIAVALETTGDYEAEYRAVWRDGSIRHISSRGKVHRDDAGRAVLMTGVCWDVTDQKDAEERLRASLREKEALLKEIHHRVKNNMQVISSLVSLQANALTDPAVREAFQDVRDRVRSMALVHEKLYQSNSLASVEFAEYARSLLHYLWRAHGSAASGVRLNFDLQPVAVPIELAVPCGLILNELAVNALKHAFRDRSSGEVTVTLRSAPEGCICLRFRDDGPGLPPDMDWRKSPSLGLRLVQMLAGQLNGTIETGAGPGTEFMLTFGLPAHNKSLTADGADENR